MRMGNTRKYLSYKFAFEQMRRAIDHGFYLEAVMIAESLISDRLQSTLRDDGEVRKVAGKGHISLGQLIKLAKQAPVPFPDPQGLDDWRKARNRVAHALAKSAPGSPTMEVAEFIQLASRTANEGVELARQAKTWSRKARPVPR